MAPDGRPAGLEQGESYWYPYTYVGSTRFTNRKHRQRVITIPLQADADFVLQGIETSGHLSWQFTISDLMSGLGHAKFVGSTFMFFESDQGGQKIWPDAVFKAGSAITCVLKLSDGVSVGRKRPRAEIILHGYYKQYYGPAHSLASKLPA